MYREIHEHQVTSLGFGRSLLWAVGVTGIASVVVASLSSLHRPIFLPACMMGAAIFYPLTTQHSPRHAARGALLAALLLVPILDSTQRPWISMLAAAVVIGLLRSWFHWAKDMGLHYRRELSCIVASLALGGYLLDPSPLGLTFGIWGFCLGQVVATLFGDPRDH